MGHGIKRSGMISATVLAIVNSLDPAGPVLADLLDGHDVDENLARDHDTAIGVLVEATPTTYGELLVGRWSLVLAPLTEEQFAQIRNSTRPNSVDERPPARQLIDFRRVLEGGKTVWSLYNVLIVDVKEYTTP